MYSSRGILYQVSIPMGQKLNVTSYIRIYILYVYMGILRAALSNFHVHSSVRLCCTLLLCSHKDPKREHAWGGGGIRARMGRVCVECGVVGWGRSSRWCSVALFDDCVPVFNLILGCHTNNTNTLKKYWVH